MHRIKINPEEWQYDVLRARAEQENRSFSDLVREILLEKLIQPEPGKGRPQEIEGVGADSAASGRAHDQFLLGGAERD